jgi:hypothetical protein
MRSISRSASSDGRVNGVVSFVGASALVDTMAVFELYGRRAASVRTALASPEPGSTIVRPPLNPLPSLVPTTTSTPANVLARELHDSVFADACSRGAPSPAGDCVPLATCSAAHPEHGRLPSGVR